MKQKFEEIVEKTNDFVSNILKKLKRNYCTFEISAFSNKTNSYSKLSSYYEGELTNLNEFSLDIKKFYIFTDTKKYIESRYYGEYGSIYDKQRVDRKDEICYGIAALTRKNKMIDLLVIPTFFNANNISIEQDNNTFSVLVNKHLVLKIKFSNEERTTTNN